MIYKSISLKSGVLLADIATFKADLNIKDLRSNEMHAVALCKAPNKYHKILIKPKDQVHKNQILAVAISDKHTSIYSPISGTIEDISEANTTLGTSISIYIKPNATLFNKTTTKLSDSEILDHGFEWQRNTLRSLGIYGLGGASFPSNLKIKKPLDLLIINAMECDPSISCDQALINDCPYKLMSAIALVSRITEAKKTVICIEDKMNYSAKLLKSEFYKLKHPNNISFKLFESIYPSGYSKILAERLTGKKIPRSKHLSDYGIQCFNIATVLAIYEALGLAKPITDRIITINGAIAKPGNYRVRLGSKVSELLDQLGRYPKNSKIIGSGVMMGIDLDPSSFIQNNINAIFIDSVPTPPESHCIKCDKCAPVCPVGLEPSMLDWHTKTNNLAALIANNIYDCIECGCCDAVCPSYIPLSKEFKLKKLEIKNNDLLEKRKACSLLRSESRKKRIQLLKKQSEDRLNAMRSNKK